MRVLAAMLLLSVSLVACRGRTAPGDNGSALTSVKLGLPTNHKGNVVLYDTYALEVTTQNSLCKDFEIANAASYQPSVSLDMVLKNDCDYLVVLKLGFANSIAARQASKGNNKTLGNPVYSNQVNGSPGYSITRNDLLNAKNGVLPVTLKVYRLSGSGPDSLQTPHTNLNVQISFGGNPNAEQPTPTPTPSRPALDAKVVQVVNNNNELKSLFNTHTDRRFIVQFSLNNCPPCTRQLGYSKAIASTLLSTNKTVFVFYEFADRQRPNKNENIWGLASYYPQTIIFEQGKEVKRDQYAFNKSALEREARSP